ncbi:MAG: HmuY family protein, partial [Gammaproteobacteria bacterium]|nr:HmuY family protein [Gammaproteobacteria bacterium]
MVSLVPLLALCLPACESEVAAPEEEVFEEGEITLDASSPVTFVYLNLADGVQLTPSDPASSTDWHMAFRRFSVRLNGGVAGPGSVGGYNLENNAGAAGEQITAMTPEDGEAAFEAVTEADIPASSSFAEDGLAPDPGASWFRFDPQAGTLVANPGVAW